MPQFSVFIATSLDGFIAGPDGNIEWLMAAGDPADTHDYGYNAFMATVDVLVMGRNSFEKVLTFGEWPYEKKVVVMSRTRSDIPAELKGKVELFAGTSAELVKKLDQEGVKRVYLDGGLLIQAFLREGLVSDLLITLIPILIGEGIPLFGPLEEHVHLELKHAEGFGNGFVQVEYEVVRKKSD